MAIKIHSNQQEIDFEMKRFILAFLKANHCSNPYFHRSNGRKAGSSMKLAGKNE